MSDLSPSTTASRVTSEHATSPHAMVGVVSSDTPLRPVFLGLRVSLHLLVTALIGFVILRQLLAPVEHTSMIIALSIFLFVSYIAGAFLTRSHASSATQALWLAIISLEVLSLVLLTADGAFLVFPLFFLHLHLLRARLAVPAIAASTAVTVVAISLHSGWSVGGVIGPVIGASVAVVIGLAYRALYRESRQRQQLIDELLATRAQLAAREREAGVLDERSRLAREIHDTVAQGLSSIQLLLHAAERSGMTGEPLTHVTLARETAAANLEETRRFIRELSPPALDGHTLVDAVSRLAAAESREGLSVNFHLSGTSRTLAMPVETTLLRIAQASLANVSQHASASRAEITLTYLEDWVGLDIVDDGQGFNPVATDRPGSFGLVALRERVETLGGSLSIESQKGSGTAIAVAFEIVELDSDLSTSHGSPAVTT